MAGLIAFRELASLLPSVTRYAAVCGSCGAAAGFLSPHLGLDAPTCMSLGLLLPLGPAVCLLNSTWWVQRELSTWKRWESSRLITPAEARDLRRVTLRALERARYGAKDADGPASSSEDEPKESAPPKAPTPPA